jgi:uncharacterized protein YajQ (UPF0234 family)
MPSFDIVSEVDGQELSNAVDQANRELEIRFDFKGSGASFELVEFVITLEASSAFQLQQMLPILSEKLARRKIDVAAMSPEEPEVSLSKARQKVVMKHGVDTDTARKIVKLIKDSKIKVQAAIQGEQLRVSGKKRDDLQQVMQILRNSKLGLPLQFSNFRD